MTNKSTFLSTILRRLPIDDIIRGRVVFRDTQAITKTCFKILKKIIFRTNITNNITTLYSYTTIFTSTTLKSVVY